MANTNWTSANIPDQTGKNILITGANSGLGFHAAMALSGKGANVIMAVRSLEKGKAAAAQIKTMYPNAKLDIMQLDLSDMDSIKHFSEAFHAKYKSLNVLMNNAGVMAIPKKETTRQGFEMQFGTNHLGHFALTGLLLDLIKKTPDARVTTQSSGLHKGIDAIQFDDINWEKSYTKWKAYAQSKLANLLFTYELDRQFKAHKINAVATVAHPGFAETNLQRYSGFVVKYLANKILAQSAQMGSLPIVRAATDKNAKGGEYYGPTKMGEMRGYPELVKSNEASYNTLAAKQLWEVSEKLTGIHYDF